MKNKNIFRMIPIWIMILLVSGCVPNVSESKTTKTVEGLFIHFVDVGQGDATYIHYKDFDMVIDGGDNKHADKLVNYLKKQSFKDLDLLIATHPHADHIGGLDDIIRHFTVKVIVDSGAKPASKTTAFTNYQAAVKAEKASYEADRNRVIEVDKHLKIEIIEMGDQFDEMNNESVIVKVTYMGDTALFTGDAERLVEDKLGSKMKRVGLFKAAHHGSSTSNSSAFLEKIQPQWVVISSGKNNDYNHPHEDVVNRFIGYTKNVFKTEDNGHIVMKSNGAGWDTSAIKMKWTLKQGASDKGVHKDKMDDKDHQNSLNALKLVETTSKVLKLKSLSVEDEVVVIENISKQQVQLKGYFLLSVIGSQKYSLPDWILDAGESVTVASGSGKGQIRWTTENIWNNSGDTAELYTIDGQLLDRIVYKK